MKLWLRWTLITMSIGGGYAGFIVAVQAFFQSEPGNPLRLGFYGAFALLYLFVIASGLLFADDERRSKPLLISLGIQIPWISSPLIGYRFAAGLHITIGIVGDHLDGGYRFGSEWQFSLSSKLSWGFGVNLAALALFLLLVIASRRSHLSVCDGDQSQSESSVHSTKSEE